MFKKLISLSVLVAAMAAGNAAAVDNASGGTINFEGAITDTTCTINGGETADFTVALTPITVTDAGTTVGIIDKTKRSIQMTFSDCQTTSAASGQTLKIYFDSADSISTDGKYLINNTVDETDAAVARNVGFALTSSGSTNPIALNQAFDTGIAGDKVAPDADTLTLDVYYYKTNASPATVGELSSNVTYTVSYL